MLRQTSALLVLAVTVSLGIGLAGIHTPGASAIGSPPDDGEADGITDAGGATSDRAQRLLDDRRAVYRALYEALPGAMFHALIPAEALAELDPDEGEAMEIVDKPPAEVIVRAANLLAVPVKRLGPVDVAALLAEDAAAAQFNKALRFGVGRNLLAEMRDGAWLRTHDGWLWVIDVQCDGAIAIRVRVLNMRLPAGATLTAYAADDPNQITEAYEEAGPFEDGEIWLPTLVTQRVRVECFVPFASLRAGALQQPPSDLFVLDRVQHVYRDPMKDFGGGGGADGGADSAGDEGDIAGGGCHNQVACHPDWLGTSYAVGGIGTINENSIWCTGQLIRTDANDRTPYFLTAHHCLSFNFEARASEVYWRYQAATCGSSPPPLNSVKSSRVCSLVSTASNTDFTLLMIEGPLPKNARWVSFATADAADGTEVVCIHHPLGKHKRISFGAKASNATCGGATHIRSNWTDGVTQPGSSGSGLFRADTRELIGQLHCGSSACGNVTNDSYGAFWHTYLGISDKLAAGSDDAYEDNDECSSAPMLPAGAHPNLVVKSVDSDWYRIRVPAGKRVTVKANFKHAWGDVDMRLYQTCNGSPVSSSVGTTNVETVTFANNGATARTLRLRVYIVNDVRNTYKLTVSLSNL